MTQSPHGIILCRARHEVESCKAVALIIFIRTFFVSLHGRGPAALFDMREDLADFPDMFLLFPVLPTVSMSDSLGLLSSSFAEMVDLG